MDGSLLEVLDGLFKVGPGLWDFSMDGCLKDTGDYYVVDVESVCEILLSRWMLTKQNARYKVHVVRGPMQKDKSQWAVEGMASVLVNGSPTSEFQFHCGLKQGDPLAPYLFILVMESLHLSVSRTVEVGIFTSIKIDSALSISHLFYADDAGVGDFCVKDARDLVDEVLLPKENVATRWIKTIPIKVNVFTWKLHLDRLPTRSNLLKHGIQEQDPLSRIIPMETMVNDEISPNIKVAYMVNNGVWKWPDQWSDVMPVILSIQVPVLNANKKIALLIWFSHCIPMNVFILWLAMIGRLATHDRIMKWYPGRNTKCLLCNNCPDSMKHLFFEFTFSSSIWEEMRKMKMMQKDISDKWEDILSRLLLCVDYDIWKVCLLRGYMVECQLNDAYPLVFLLLCCEDVAASKD
ncbi:RNA-directed DNA polymerase, eukaryota [Tanacetum coccineum]